jgi:asparaginyl-tRNA synthetase
MTALFALDQVSTLLSTPSEALPRQAATGGWLTSCRMSKRVGFLVLHDGSSVAPLQVVVPDALLQEQPALRGLTAGCSVRVRGTLVVSQGAGQRLEMQAEHVEVLGWVEDPVTYPIQPKPLGADFLRTVPHLRARVVHMAAVARLRHVLAQAIHGYFAQHGFTWVATPVLTSGDAEGAGERFQVVTDEGPSAFFGREAFLTVSGQLEAEALCMALGRVYTFGPTFRAERSRTSRHLAEFWMVEPEVAFAGLTDLMGLSEGLVKHCIAQCLTHLPEEMALFAQEGSVAVESWEAIVQAPFARVTYTEAIALLEQADVTFSTPVAWGDDLHAEHERWLVERLGGPVFVTHYPADLKAFYMKETEGGRTVAAMDLLVPRVGELVGGSEREEDLERLTARMRHHGLDPADYPEYLDLRRYGTVPHGGFGLGFERLVAFVSGVASVKDAIAFPRVAGG